MEVAIRHYLPGRVRLHVPELCRKPTIANAALAWLQGKPGVKSARLNFACSCLVLEYDRARERELQGLLDQLRRLPLAAVGQALVQAGAPADGTAADAAEAPATQSNTKNSNAPPTKAEVPGLLSPQTPLLLPTVSLGLALLTNPVVLAV